MKNSYKELTYAEILSKRNDLKKDYRKLRFDMVMGHVENPLRKRTLRRDVARANTIVREYELGIRSDKTGDKNG